ncbi:MAG: ParA family protein [Chloroflexales bacterium]|nr:ParA family protein [Chloroflexales bacterium]
MTVLGVVMQKGGVGKSTTTLSLGVELGRLGARVLLVDMDAQSSLTQAVGFDLTHIEHSVYDVLMNPVRGIEPAIQPAGFGVDIVPATLGLARAELVLAGHVGRELLLRRALQGVREVYDYILIDSPPSLGLLTLNTMAASDALLVPLQAHVFALHAMGHLEETITLVQQLHPTIAIGGIVMTMVDKRTSVNQAVDQAARERYGDLVFETVIPFNVKLVEAPAAGQPIGLYAPNSTSAQAYARLAEEVRARYG